VQDLKRQTAMRLSGRDPGPSPPSHQPRKAEPKSITPPPASTAPNYVKPSFKDWKKQQMKKKGIDEEAEKNKGPKFPTNNHSGVGTLAQRAQAAQQLAAQQAQQYYASLQHSGSLDSHDGLMEMHHAGDPTQADPYKVDTFVPAVPDEPAGLPQYPPNPYATGANAMYGAPSTSPYGSTPPANPTGGKPGATTCCRNGAST